MDHRASIGLFILLLLFSVALSRNLKDEESLNPLPETQDFEKQGFARRLLSEKEEASFVEGRMDFERTDYSGTGANNHHDPKPPGGV